MGIEDRQAKEARFEAVSESIRHLWKPDAENIYNLLDQGSGLVVVGAPGGSGKSMDLLPELVVVGRERGYTTWSLDCQTLPSRNTEEVVKSLGYRLAKANIPENVTKGIAILDEPLIETKGIKEVLEFLRGHNLRSTIGLFRTQNPQDEQILNDWMGTGREVGTVSLYRMRAKQLPEALARDFLSTFDNVTPELIDYIVINFPLYPRVLEFLRSGRNEREVREQWKDLVLRINKGWGFTQEEAENVNQRLRKEP